MPISLRSSRFLSFPFPGGERKSGRTSKRKSGQVPGQKLGEKWGGSSEQGGGGGSFHRLTPSPLLPNFLLSPGACPLFRSLVRSPPERKGNDCYAGCMPICHVTGAQSCGCPTTGIQFELFVTGYLCDSHANCTGFNGFLCNVSCSFQNL